jgi:hypothetical protein
MMTEPGAPPAIARLASALLLSQTALDRLGRVVDLGVEAEARLSGAPTQHSLTLQTLIADARREAHILSRLSRVGPGYGPAVASCTTVGTREAARLLGIHQRTVQRRAREYGGRLVRGVWRLDRATVEAAAASIAGVDA